MKIKRPDPSQRPVVRKLPPKLKINASIARSRSSRVQDEDEDYYDTPEPNMKLSHAFVVVLVLHVIAVGGVFAFNTIKANQRPNAIAESLEPTSATAPSTEPVTAPPSGMVAPPSPVAVAKSADQSTQSSAIPEKPLSAPPVAASTGTTHEVKSGETLTRIATQYGVSVAALQEANAIEDPTKIRIGTLLVIPTTAKASAPAPVTAQTATKPVVTKSSEPVTAAASKPAPAATSVAAVGIKDSGKIYEVAKGDNPVSIARKLNVPYNDLLALNNIDDPRRLQIGQKLKVPASN